MSNNEKLLKAAQNSIVITQSACRIAEIIQKYRGSKLGWFIQEKIHNEVTKILAANDTTFANQTRDNSRGSRSDGLSSDCI